MLDDMQSFALGGWLKSMRQLEGWSYNDVARVAGSHGHKVSASGVERMEKTQPTMVKKDQIAWIVDVFGVPPRSVVRMFLQGMGYGLNDSSVASIEDAVLTDAQLSKRDKQLLNALLAAMRSATRGEGESWPGSPTLEESQLGVAETDPATPLGSDRPPQTAPDLRSLPTGRDLPPSQ